VVLDDGDMNLAFSLAAQSAIEQQTFNVTILQLYHTNVTFELSANWRRPIARPGTIDPHRFNNSAASGEFTLGSVWTVGATHLDSVQRNITSLHLPIVTYNDVIGQPNQDLNLELYNLGCYCGRHDDYDVLADGFEGATSQLNLTNWPNSSWASCSTNCGSKTGSRSLQWGT
jgi:hypothetical protein